MKSINYGKYAAVFWKHFTEEKINTFLTMCFRCTKTLVKEHKNFLTQTKNKYLCQFLALMPVTNTTDPGEINKVLSNTEAKVM